MNYFDLFIGGVLLLAFFQGYRKGIFFSVTKVVSYVAGLAVAIYYYPHLSQWLDEQFNLIESLANFIYGLLPLPSPVLATNVAGLSFHELTTIVASLPLPKFYQQQLLAYLDNYQLLLAGSILSIGEALTLILANTLVEISSFGLLLAATVALVGRLSRLIPWPANNSLLGGANKLAGATLGLAAGILVTVVMLGLLVPVVVLGEIAQIQGLAEIARQANESLLLPVFLSLFTFFQSSVGGVLPFASGIFQMN